MGRGDKNVQLRPRRCGWPADQKFCDSVEMTVRGRTLQDDPLGVESSSGEPRVALEETGLGLETVARLKLGQLRTTVTRHLTVVGCCRLGRWVLLHLTLDPAILE